MKKIPFKGRGVFCNHAIEQHHVIESCPIISFTDEYEKQLLKSTVLADYLFFWNDDKTTSVIALGYGSLYNHSTNANARYEMNEETGLIDIISLVFIPRHTEITINYNGIPGCTSLNWFSMRNIEYRQ